MNKDKISQLMLHVGAIALFALPLTLTGCNTMEGAGQDIQAGGKSLERAAERNK